MSKRKSTFTQRLNAANDKVQRALDVFDRAAKDLEAAAEEAAAVVTETEAEVQRLTEIRDRAYGQSVKYVAKAEKIREFTL